MKTSDKEIKGYKRNRILEERGRKRHTKGLTRNNKERKRTEK